MRYLCFGSKYQGARCLTCEVVLRVEQFTGHVPFQLVGFVPVRRQASLPVHPAVAQPLSVESVRAHPQQHAPLQGGRRSRGALVRPPQGREGVHGQGHHLGASGRHVVLLWGARRDVAALWTGRGHLPHQSAPHEHGHVETEVWAEDTGRASQTLVLKHVRVIILDVIGINQIDRS